MVNGVQDGGNGYYQSRDPRAPYAAPVENCFLSAKLPDRQRDPSILNYARLNSTARYEWHPIFDDSVINLISRKDHCTSERLL